MSVCFDYGNYTVSGFESISNGNSRSINTVQVLRGFSALLVVLFHTSQYFCTYYKIAPMGGFFGFGFSGVHIFFVLSGFIIFRVHFNDIGRPEKFIRYIKKRFIRIYPIYWVSLGVISYWMIKHGIISIEAVYSNIILLKMPPSFINQVCWTLSFEVFFYLVFSFLILNRTAGISIILCWIAAVAVNNIWGVGALKLLGYGLHKYTTLFLIGVLVSCLLFYLKKLPAATRDLIGYISLASGILFFSFTAAYCLFSRIIQWDLWSLTIGFGLAGGMLVISSVSTKIEQALGRSTFLRVLGDASYSIYLIHFFFLLLVISNLKIRFPLEGALPVLLAFIGVSAITVFAGVLMYWVVERPLLAVMRKVML